MHPIKNQGRTTMQGGKKEVENHTNLNRISPGWILLQDSVEIKRLVCDPRTPELELVRLKVNHTNPASKRTELSPSHRMRREVRGNSKLRLCRCTSHSIG